MDVDVLLFDVGGTVFDWRTAIAETVASAPSSDLRALDAGAFSSAWREQSIVERYEIAYHEKPWRTFDAWLNTSLDVVLERPRSLRGTERGCVADGRRCQSGRRCPMRSPDCGSDSSSLLTP